jgi:hypothetical protein
LADTKLNESLVAKSKGLLTSGSSDRASIIFGEPMRESMIGINQLRLMSAHPRVAQPHR